MSRLRMRKWADAEQEYTPDASVLETLTNTPKPTRLKKKPQMRVENGECLVPMSEALTPGATASRLLDYAVLGGGLGFLGGGLMGSRNYARDYAGGAVGGLLIGSLAEATIRAGARKLRKIQKQQQPELDDFYTKVPLSW